MVRNAGTGFFYANPAAPGAAPTLQFQADVAQYRRDPQIDLAGGGQRRRHRPPANTLGTPEVFSTARRDRRRLTRLPLPRSIRRRTSRSNPCSPCWGVRSARWIPIAPLARQRPKTSPRSPPPCRISPSVDLNNDGTADIVVPDQVAGAIPDDLPRATGPGISSRDRSTQAPFAPGDNDGIFLGTTSNATTLTSVGSGWRRAVQRGRPAAVRRRGAVPFVELHLISNANTSVFYSGGAPRKRDVRHRADAHPGRDHHRAGRVLHLRPHAGRTCIPVTGYRRHFAGHRGLPFLRPVPPDRTTATILRTSASDGERLLPQRGQRRQRHAGVGRQRRRHRRARRSPASNGDLAGVVQIIFPQSIDFSGQAFLLAGSGGNGFAGGGNGGSIEGVDGALRRRARRCCIPTSCSRRATAATASPATAATAAASTRFRSHSGVYFSAGNGGSGRQRRHGRQHRRQRRDHVLRHHRRRRRP